MFQLGLVTCGALGFKRFTTALHQQFTDLNKMSFLVMSEKVCCEIFESVVHEESPGHAGFNILLYDFKRLFKIDSLRIRKNV